MDMGEGKTYTLFQLDGEPSAGMMESGMPMSYWSMYFNVEDCKNMAAKASSMGAKVVLEPTTAEGVGTFAILSDPQGAMFGVLQPEAMQ